MGRHRPGEVRDAIVHVLEGRNAGATVHEIREQVSALIGSVPQSSVRSYLQLNTPALFARTDRGQYTLAGFEAPAASVNPGRCEPAARRVIGDATLVLADCIAWLDDQPANSVHAVVTDPPYGMVEYSDDELDKLRRGRGGVWRIPPSFDGARRSPLPRFTVLTPADLAALERFFLSWGRSLLRVLVPGANVVVASNPLLSHIASGALARAGLERRGELVRLVMTMRGGDRPKAAHVEFSGVSVMPRSMWEPWLLFRKPLEGRVQDNLRRWGTGGFRRISEDRPFGDVIESAPTRASERRLAKHPSLKPQAFLRRVVRGVLPLGTGHVLDPFAGSGSTLAAAQAVGYSSIGVERDPSYFDLAIEAIPKLAALRLPDLEGLDERPPSARTVTAAGS
ncbi:MAG: site-specific DNA-methyltransferase [Rhodoferax sp.]|jgi:site-specific DNA-methyltransferase (adenine-specific)|nr:site-specific DNA-methyltransferase [Rhodoferax sp.]